MIPVVTAAEMRDIDRITIEELGLPGVLLMEHAGAAVADAVRAYEPQRIAVVCGAGNNGGDGYVASRWLHAWGYEVVTYLACGEPRTGSDAALHLGALRAVGGEIRDLSEAGWGERQRELDDYDVVVDALFGTGLMSEVRDPVRRVIRRMNELDAVRVAVDVPSGLDSDTGQVLGVAVEADVTVTFGFPKVGLASYPGMELAGDVHIADIGIPHRLADHVKLGLLEEEDAAAMVPHRRAGSHKGTHGHVLVVAGSPGKVGAGLLAARAAFRAGAGLVTWAVARDAHSQAEGKAPEVMCVPLDYAAAKDLRPAMARTLLDKKGAVVWGPGVPGDPQAGLLLDFMLPRMGVPCVLDADALNHFAGNAGMIARADTQCVLTPHPAEAARLLGVETDDVQRDRVGAARKLAGITKAVVALKGARTIVASPDGRAVINPSGNPGLGSGGTGDVLAGVIGALLAQGLDPFEAAQLGVYVHGAAGDLVAGKRGQIGMIASDVVDALPEAFVTLQRDEETD